jgi:thiosulfate/3-mercaptopyruvate sulfurtransferase
LRHTILRCIALCMLIITHPVVIAHHDKLGSAKPLVNADWLMQEQAEVVIVDVRDIELYATGHLPGAINIPSEWSFNQAGDKTRIASLNQIRDVFSRAGIHNDDYVVLYDDGSLLDAAHVFWAMETYGHRNVSVLNGGLHAWLAQDGKLTEQVEARPPSNYIPSISPHHMSTKLTTRLAIETKHIAILDSRPPEEYRGEESWTKRKGHIPGAINIPWDRNLSNLNSENGARLISDDALQTLYQQLDGARQVITYCNRGKESTVSYLVLRHMNRAVSVYDGAWLEWATDSNLPVNRPE